MKYEFIRKVLMDSYPSLYAVEADVLNKLFFCFNHYIWKNGEVVLNDDNCPEYNYQDEVDTAKEEYLKFCESSLNWEKHCRKPYDLNNITSEKVKKSLLEIPKQMVDYWENEIVLETTTTPKQKRQREINRRLEYLKQGEDGALDCWRILPGEKIGIVVAPIREDSLLLSVGNDITDDWKEVIKKTFRILGKELVPSDAWKEKHFYMVKELNEYYNGAF